MNTILTDDERRTAIKSVRYGMFTGPVPDDLARAVEAAVLTKLEQQADRQRVPEGLEYALRCCWKLFDELDRIRAANRYEEDWDSLDKADDEAREAVKHVSTMLAAAPEAPAQFDWSKFPGHLIDHYEGETLTEELLQQAAAELAAPQEPVQASAVDERAAFEHDMKAEPNGFGPDWFETDQHGNYTAEEMDLRWLGWQARAALVQKGGK